MLTPTQRRMARHALGLPSAKNKSYRNRYFAPLDGDAAKDFNAMVKKGLAGFEYDKGQARYWLTRDGAELALDRGERLCGEDFPI